MGKTRCRYVRKIRKVDIRGESCVGFFFIFFFLFFFLQIRIKVLLCLGIRRFLLNFRYIEMKTHCFITFLFLVLCYCWSATGNYCWGKSSWHDDYCGSDDRYHGCYKGKCWKQCGQGGSYWCYMGEKEMTTSSHYKMRQIYCNAKQQDVGKFCHDNTDFCKSSCGPTFWGKVWDSDHLYTTGF